MNINKEEYFNDWFSYNKPRVLIELAIQRGIPTDKDTLCKLEEDEWEEMMELAEEMMYKDIEIQETEDNLIKNKF